MVFNVRRDLGIDHLRNIAAFADRLADEARGDLDRFGDNTADDGVVFFGIFADLFQDLVRYKGIVFAADIDGVAELEDLLGLVPLIECQEHIGTAEEEEARVGCRQLSESIDRIAYAASAKLEIADDNAFDVAESKLAHFEAVERIGNKIILLMRRNCGGDDEKIVKPHLSHKSLCGFYVTDMGRRKGSAVDTYAPDVFVISVH